MARPRIPTGDTILVRIDGGLLAWTDGYLSGDPELVRRAKQLSSDRAIIRIPRTPYPYAAILEDKTNRAGALAAMVGVEPGRAQILQVDEETLECVNSGKGSIFGTVRRLR